MLFAVLSCLLDSSLHAVTFTWSSPVSFNSMSAVQIFTNTNNTPGTIVGAVGFGVEAPTVVTIATNYAPIVFDTFADPTVATVSGTNGISYGTGTFPAATTNTTGNTNLNTVLNNYAYQGKTQTITLINLVPGAKYSAQLFFGR